MITPQNFDADIDNADVLGMMIQLKPDHNFEGGTVLLMPHRFGPPIHFHPYQDEIFRVKQGTMEVLKGKKWFSLKAGDKLIVPRGMPHSFRNISNEVAVFDFAVTPKIGLTYLLLTLDELVKIGKIKNLTSLRSKVYFSQALVAFPRVVKHTYPPQILLRLIANLGTAFGLTITREKFRAQYFRPVKLWKGRHRNPVDIDLTADEVLF